MRDGRIRTDLGRLVDGHRYSKRGLTVTEEFQVLIKTGSDADAVAVAAPRFFFLLECLSLSIKIGAAFSRKLSSDGSKTTAAFMISVKADKLLGNRRYTYRWLKRLLTRFSSPSVTSSRVVRPRTAIGAFFDCAISSRLYSSVCRGCPAKRSNSSMMKITDLATVSSLLELRFSDG